VIAPSSNWFAGYFPSGGASKRRTLPETGTYTIRVYANSVNASFVGPYSFRTWCEVTAGPDQVATLPNTALSVPLIKFLCNDGFEIGDAPTINLTNSASEYGGTLTLTNNALTCTGGGVQRRDRFTYRLQGISVMKTSPMSACALARRESRRNRRRLVREMRHL
jgi:hypothetical protein